MPRISVLITVSSSHRFQGTHKHIWVYHFLFAFCFSYEQRNVRRWMLHKYVGNMLKESTLLNNEHEHVKIIMHIKIKPWTFKHFSKHHIHLSESFLNREWSCKQIQIGFSPFHVAQKHISILSLSTLTHSQQVSRYNSLQEKQLLSDFYFLKGKQKKHYN